MCTGLKSPSTPTISTPAAASSRPTTRRFRKPRWQASNSPTPWVVVGTLSSAMEIAGTLPQRSLQTSGAGESTVLGARQTTGISADPWLSPGHPVAIQQLNGEDFNLRPPFTCTDSMKDLLSLMFILIPLYPYLSACYFPLQCLETWFVFPHFVLGVAQNLKDIRI